MIKKILSVICLLVLAVPCMLLTACKTGPECVGTYSVISVEMGFGGDNQIVTRAEYDAAVESGDIGPDIQQMAWFFEMTMDVKKDQTVVVTEGGEGAVGSWTYENKNLTISYTEEGETTTSVLTYSDGKLTMDMSESGATIIIIFQKG